MHSSEICRNFAVQKAKQNADSVAQLVEQLTLNQWVESSSLSGVTTKKDAEIFSILFLLLELFFRHVYLIGYSGIFMYFQ